MTAVIKLLKSIGDPILIFLVSSTTFEINSSDIDFGIYILDAAEHFWP